MGEASVLAYSGRGGMGAQAVRMLERRRGIAGLFRNADDGELKYAQDYLERGGQVFVGDTESYHVKYDWYGPNGEP